MTARCHRERRERDTNRHGAGPALRFVRLGTLDEPDRQPPDIHIFTASWQPWLELPAGVAAVALYYDRDPYWPAQSLARRQALLPAVKTHLASLQRRFFCARPRPQAKWVSNIWRIAGGISDGMVAAEISWFGAAVVRQSGLSSSVVPIAT